MKSILIIIISSLLILSWLELPSFSLLHWSWFEFEWGALFSFILICCVGVVLLSLGVVWSLLLIVGVVSSLIIGLGSILIPLLLMVALYFVLDKEKHNKNGRLRDY